MTATMNEFVPPPPLGLPPGKVALVIAAMIGSFALVSMIPAALRLLGF